MKSMILCGALLALSSLPALAAVTDDTDAQEPATVAAPSTPKLDATCFNKAGSLQKVLPAGNPRQAEDFYQDYLKIPCPDHSEVHYMGSQVALKMGNVSERLARISLAVKACPGTSACTPLVKAAYLAEVKTIYQEYGKVSLSASAKARKACSPPLGPDGKTPTADPPFLVLMDGGLPLDPTKRAPLYFADKALCDMGSFAGYLPVGGFTIAGTHQTVAPLKPAPAAAGTP